MSQVALGHVLDREHIEITTNKENTLKTSCLGPCLFWIFFALSIGVILGIFVRIFLF